MSSVGRKLAPGNNDRGGGGKCLGGDPTFEEVLRNLDTSSFIATDYGFTGTEELISYVVRIALPAAIETFDVELSDTCEVFLAEYGIYVPNPVSGRWQPLSVPKNELQLREQFAHRMPEYGYELIRSGSEFPDWLLKRRQDGQFVYAEVEHRSSSFLLHGHDPELCDLVVCWEHDDEWLPLPVLELFSGMFTTPSSLAKSADKGKLQVRINGGPHFKPQTLAKSRSSRKQGRGRTIAKRILYGEWQQMKDSGLTSGEAIKHLAKEYDYRESTISTYLSHYKHGRH